MSDIKYAIEIFKEYGYIGLIMAIVGLVLLGLIKGGAVKKLWSLLTDKFVERFMAEKTKDQSVGRSITDSDIMNHDIFNYIDLWKYSRIPTLQFSTEYRTVVFRKYLTIYLNSYRENLQRFLSESEYKEMDDAQIWRAFLNLINDIIYDYERQMEEVGISKIIIEKMKVKNNETIQLIIDLIEGICNSHFYESEKNYLKVYSILNIILSVLENTIQSSESVCNSINGQLKGLTFNDGGRTITE